VISADCQEGSVKLENSEVLGGFDLIIAADGIHSQLRESVLNKRVQPKATGVSAYRMMIDTALLEAEPEITSFMNPREPVTTMVVGHDRRLIMGPARNGEVYSIVAMVPDQKMNEDPSRSSWTTKGDIKSLLESFHDFPNWCKRVFSHCNDIGLWQLRDLDPLDAWVKDRAILVGDASHAMLPTQGQGASQSIEDAEALGAFFADIDFKPTAAQVSSRLQEIEALRKPRTSAIQSFSRLTARPQGEKGQGNISLKVDEFMNFNCNYKGVKDWQQRLENGSLCIPSIAG
jgi:salicylate hydroxylase